MKRLLTLVVIFLCNMSTIFAHAIEVQNVDGVTIYYNWTNNKTELSVSYRGSLPNSNAYSGNVVIPDTVTYDGKTYSVTSIGHEAFQFCTGLTSVEIPNSVTSIDLCAFFGCSGLTSITIPNSVISIGANAFYGCSALTSLIIPNNVNSIGGSAFRNCSGLTSVTIGNNVTSIGNNAFYGCSSLTSVTIPNSVTSIGNYAFTDCSSLSSIEIPNNVTSIGNNVFYGCSSLTSVTIPNSVTAIGIYAFTDCSSLTKVMLNSNAIVSKSYNSVYTIGNIFGSNVKEYIIGDSVTSIGNSAFENCSDLTYVTIGNNVTFIGDNAFKNCNGLTSVTIPINVTSIGNSAFAGCSAFTSLTIPNNVTSIGDSAFEGCTGLTKVITTDIDAWCKTNFANTTSNPLYYAHHLYRDDETEITQVSLPEDITNIKSYVFYNCSGLKSITIPNCVTTIGVSAFYNCSSLTSITIPNSVTSIGKMAFDGCSALTKVEINSDAIVSKTYSSNSSLKNIFGSQVKEYIIGDDVTAIGNYAFYGTNLMTLIVGSVVLSIGSNAFSTRPVKTIWLPNTPPQNYTVAQGTVNYVANNQYGSMNNKKEYKFLSSIFEVDGLRYVPVSPSERTCDAIDCVYDESAEEITIGESITNKGISLKIQDIQPYLCFSNTYIKKVNVKSSYKGNIPSCSFYGCTSITSIDINNQGDIAENAFDGCSSIISASISNEGSIGDRAFYGSATKDTATFVINNKGDIGTSAFEGCTKITQITIDNKGSIGGSGFYGCTSLQTAMLGNNITKIGASAFKNCSNLESIVIPYSVQTLGGSAFNGCSSMISAKIGDGIKLIDESTFSSCSSLKDVEIGDSVTSIATSAFSGCETLPEIRIPQNVTAIGNSAFSDCKALPEIRIPQNVTTIGNRAFGGCTGLKTVIMADRQTEGDLKLGYTPFVDCSLDSVYIGRNITYNTSSSYGFSPFYCNPTLRSVTITDNETEILEYEFYGCTNLQNVKIGNGVTSIGNWAFSGCSKLKNFSFGTQVKTIGQEAFSDCISVTAISSKAQTPPVCGSQALDDINKWECILYVLEGHVAEYQAADQWKEFFFIEEGDIPGFIRGDVNGDGIVNGTDIQAIINLIVESLYDEKGDVNDDGQVNGTDIQEVINYIVYGPDEDTGDDDNGDDELYDNFIFEDSTYSDAEDNCTPKAESGWELWQAGERRAPNTNFNYNGTRIFNNLALKGLKVGYYCNGQWPDGYMIYGNASLDGAPKLNLPVGSLDITYYAANWKVSDAHEIFFQILDEIGNVVAENVTYTSENKNMNGSRSANFEADKFAFTWNCPTKGQYKIKFGSPSGEILIGNISIVQKKQ